MVRVANSRHNFMTDAQAKVWIMATTGSGRTRGRRFHRITLERDDSPMFVLSWSLFHVIDEHSPLYGMTEADFEAMDAGFVVIITGHDENYGQEVRARHYYEHEDLRWRHRYVDIFDMRSNSQQHVDFNLFHDTEPLAMED
jgi:inward rectifier potassium channel